MAERAGCQDSFVEKPLYYTYFINFFPKVKAIDSKIFKELYVFQSLSLSQIAEKLNISKTAVRSFVKKCGLSTKTSMQKQQNPKNYRLAQPPYGYKKGVNSGLTVNRVELKICRRIIFLRSEGVTFRGIQLELERQKFKNRRKTISWHTSVVQRIFHQWKGKL